MLAALGRSWGLRVLDAACGPGLYLRELLGRGAKVAALMPARSWRPWPGSGRQAGWIDQAALGEPLPWRLDEHENGLGNLGSCGTPHQLAAIMKNRLKRI